MMLSELFELPSQQESTCQSKLEIQLERRRIEREKN